jgi:NTP pyrophosphatase (non-canonical NTP hydrolase)
MKNKDKKIVYNHLLNVNDSNYTIQKTIEELLELALILQQKLNKPDLVFNEQIIEEIGDVKIRMKVLIKLYPIKLIKKRVNFKLTKFKKYITTKKYKNI